MNPVLTPARLAGLALLTLALSVPPARAVTELYLDLDPGSPSSSPKDGFLDGSELWFQADKVLYRFDGVTAIPEVNLSPDLFSQAELTAFDGDIYMQGVGLSLATGEEIFRYDLATGNVELALELIPGSLGSLPRHLTALDGFLYFNATNPDIELYRTDGTTVTEIDIWPGAGSSNPYDLTVFNGELFFIATNPGTGYQTLYRLNGLTATPISPEIQSAAELIVWNGALYMTGTNNNGPGIVNRGALWRYDGNGLVLEVDIDPSDTVSLPMRNLQAHTDGSLYFRGDDGTTGQELWKYDGFNATIMQDFLPGPSGLIPLELCSVNGRIVFQGRVGNDTELYGSDGSSVFLLQDIRPGSSGSAPKCLTGDREGVSYGGWAYYQANDGTNGVELWRTNGWVTAVAAPLPSAADARLSAPSPNPFAQDTRFSLTLSRTEAVDVGVFDVAGRRVATLHDGTLPAGRSAFRWSPQGAGSGVYFLRATGASASESRRIVLRR